MSMPSAKSEEQQPAPQERFKLRSVAFFGRTLDEYLQMFALAPESLQGQTILDVVNGPLLHTWKLNLGRVQRRVHGMGRG